jgi:hypothetical protein
VQLRSYSSIKNITLAILFSFGLLQSFAQVEIQPVRKADFAPGLNTSKARTRADIPLPLPFWDDFSTPSGMFVNENLWVNSNSVWVNNTMAENQPTINVATFDGLDSTGLAYDPNNVLVTGYTDKLTSQPINLAAPDIDRTTTYLSFFYQWQGNGEAPDLSDYLELQYKDNLDVWRTVLSIYPKITFERRVFYDTAIQVSDESFFHDDFQFRFRSFGRQSGPFDTWNIDYVYLNDERIAEDMSFPERAAASNLSSPFGYYTAIPYWHFDPIDFRDTVVSFAVQNLSDLIDPVTNERDYIQINYIIKGTFVNYIDGVVSTVTDDLTTSVGVNNGNGDMEPFQRLIVNSDSLFEESEVENYFSPNADSVDVILKAVVESDDEVDKQREKVSPLDMRVNDTISNTFRLHDYYAYDDGVAEYSAGLIEAGSQMAYQFQLVYNDTTEAGTPAALLGFDIYFPGYGITSNQTVQFFVFEESKEDPGTPGESLVTVTKGLERKGINEFQKVRFTPGVMVSHKFYIGWQQPVAGKALVGLDIGTDTGDKIFYSTDKTNWQRNDVVKGSLMIRPVFGIGEIEQGPGVGVEDDLRISLYPNPAKGSFYIEGRYDQLQIFNSTGSAMQFETEPASEGKTKITLQEPAGLYVVRFSHKKRTATYKVLLTR